MIFCTISVFYWIIAFFVTDIYTLIYCNQKLQFVAEIGAQISSWGWVTTKPSICLIFTACTADAVLKKRAATTATVYVLSFSHYWAKRCWRGLTRQWDEISTFSGKDCSPCALRQCRPPSLKPWSSPMRSWSWWWEHFSSTSAAWSGLFATQNWATMRRRVELRKKWCSARTTTLISHCRHTGAPVCSRTLRMDSRTPLMSTFGTTQMVCCQTAPRFAVKMVELSTTLEVTRTEQLVTSFSTLFSLFIVYVLHHRSDLCPWTFMQCLTEVIKILMQKLHFKLLYYTIFRFLRSRLQWSILSWIKKNVKISTKQIPLFTVSWKITAKTLALLFCVLKSDLYSAVWSHWLNCASGNQHPILELDKVSRQSGTTVNQLGIPLFFLQPPSHFTFQLQ